MIKKRLITKKINAGIGNAGIGYIIIPPQASGATDRDTYIKNCYSTCRVDISGGSKYGVLSDVLINESVIQQIRFPTGIDDDNFGSPVVWVLDEYNQVPIIVSVLREDGMFFDVTEGQSRVYKEIDNKSIDVTYDAKNALYSVILNGNDASSLYSIKVFCKNKDSKVKIYCDNEIDIQAQNLVSIVTNKEVDVKVVKDGKNKVEINYKDEDGLSYKDEFNNVLTAKKDGINVKSDEDIVIESNKNIIHNNGNESMVLGNTLKQLLNELIIAVENITVTCPSGGGTSSMPINIPQLEIVKSKLENIMSKKSKLE